MESTYRFRFGNIEFDQDKFELSVDGSVIDIEKRPLEILCVLLLHAGEVVSKDTLFDLVWGDDQTGDGALTNAVSRLRSALGKDNAGYIVTRPRVGYLFSGKLERVALSTSDTAGALLVADQPVPGRTDFILESLLSVSDRSTREVWLARPVSRENKNKHVFKFTFSGDVLRQLKRELTLSAILQQSPSTQASVAAVCGHQFETPPFYIESHYLGPDLLNWARDQGGLASMTRDERLALFLQIAETVSSAHKLGVLHKDLKPANILISRKPDGSLNPVLADFGSSHLLAPDLPDDLGIVPLGLTLTLDELPNSRSGSLMYLAPEIWSGQNHSVQSDVYALGILLFQILRGDLASALPADWAEQLDDEFLTEDIHKATTTCLDERLQSVAELIDRLNRLQERKALKVEQEHQQRLLLEQQSALDRNRARRPWLAAAAVFLITGLATTSWMYQRAHSAQKTAEQHALTATTLNHFWQQEIIDSADPFKKDATPLIDVLKTASLEVEGQFGHQPDIAASIHQSLGRAFLGLTDYPQSIENLTKAYEGYTQVYGSDSSEAWTARLILSLPLIQAGNLEEATTILDDFRAQYTAGSPQAWYFYYIARSSLLENTQHWQKAAELLEQALALVADVDLTREEIVKLHIRLSAQYTNIDRHEDAERILDQIPIPEDSLSVALRAMVNLERGNILLDLEDYAIAEPVLLAQYARLKASLGEHGYLTLKAASYLSTLYIWWNRKPEAMPYAEETYRIAEANLGPHSPGAITSKAQYGLLLYYTGKNQQAIEVLSDVSEDFVQHISADSAYLHMTYYYLAEALTAEERYPEAQTVLSKVKPDRLAAAMSATDAELRLTLLSALNHWFTDGSQRDVIESRRADIQGCECELEKLTNRLVAMIAEDS